MISHVKLTVLSENRVINPGLRAEQGLSIFVETSSGNILFDTGTRSDLFIHNLNELNIDLNKINMVVISHEHSDHTGGLFAFLEQNHNLSANAAIYPDENNLPGFPDQV